MEPDPSPFGPAPAAIEARSLVKRFGTITALEGVSLSVPAGQVTALLGPSGSGKSTLLRCLNGLELADSGSLVFEGRAVEPGERALDRLRSHVGMVFQQFNLFSHLSAQDNVALAPRVVHGLSAKAAGERARACLERVGLSGRASHFPTQLSGGEQQRAAIARALAMEPRVLLFDEPTSALDPELTGEVLDVMASLAAEGRTMVVVTHEVAFARAAASEWVLMDAGRIVERGAPDQVMHAPATERAARFFARHGERPSPSG